MVVRHDLSDTGRVRRFAGKPTRMYGFRLTMEFLRRQVPEGDTARPQSQLLGVVDRLQVLGKEADENLGAVVMELEKHLC